ncbi:MAG: hypothetical protein FWG23_00775 [Eggerthellaceae bacterium]|nr:hypothetical protein [Eggerthellaceae bacterium]
MIKSKRTILILLGAALAAAVVLGMTLAALGATTSQHENMFSPSPNITAKLSEPNWEGDEAIRLVPGKTVRKDPMITNTSRVEEYVAMRLTFCYANPDPDRPDPHTPMSEADLDRLLACLEIEWSDSWTPFRGLFAPPDPPVAPQPMAFYYNYPLAPGQASEPLFSSVRIKNEFDDPPDGGLTEADLDFLKSLGRFSFYIEGAAVQTVGFTDAADASETLYALFP